MIWLALLIAYSELVKVNQLTASIIGAAIEVHRELGPGKPEAAYETALLRELELRGIACRAQKAVPIVYKGFKLDCGYRLDVLVEDRVVLEVKSVEAISPVHRAQVLTYLKLGGWQVALLLNFNVVVLKDGLQRLVLGLEEGFGNKIQIDEVHKTQSVRAGHAPSFNPEMNSGDEEAEQFAAQVISRAIEVLSAQMRRDPTPGRGTCVSHATGSRSYSKTASGGATQPT